MGRRFQETGWETDACLLHRQDWDQVQCTSPRHPPPRQGEAESAVTPAAVLSRKNVGPASPRTAGCWESLRDGAHQGLGQPHQPFL